MPAPTDDVAKWVEKFVEGQKDGVGHTMTAEEMRAEHQANEPYIPQGMDWDNGDA